KITRTIVVGVCFSFRNWLTKWKSPSYQRAATWSAWSSISRNPTKTLVHSRKPRHRRDKLMAKGDVGQRQDGALGLLDFPRDVTAQTRETAYFAYNELARAKVKAVGFNFSTTDYMNSAGIGLIINLVEDATQAGRKVFAYGLGSHYRKLFGMVGLTERI